MHNILQSLLCAQVTVSIPDSNRHVFMFFHNIMCHDKYRYRKNGRKYPDHF